MQCALCKNKEANKKNTHYLSDGIIRKCLNLDGSNQREKGFYFDISSSNPFVEFNFQRIDEVTLENALGRKPTEEELENARQIPYSVDYVFCNNCEDIFTEIENAFTQKILPKFRNEDLTDIPSLSLDETSMIRKFFILQIWRSDICEDNLELSNVTMERLRDIILNDNESLLNTFPLQINYLQTLGGDKAFTENYIGFTNDKNPYIIFMNDFVIQFYEDVNSITFQEFYGLNNKADFKSIINYKEEKFLIKVVPDAERKALLNNITKSEKVDTSLEYLKNTFDLMWQHLFGHFPAVQIKAEYISGLVGDDKFNVTQYSKNEILVYTQNFIMDKMKK